MNEFLGRLWTFTPLCMSVTWDCRPMPSFGTLRSQHVQPHSSLGGPTNLIDSGTHRSESVFIERNLHHVLKTNMQITCCFKYFHIWKWKSVHGIYCIDKEESMWDGDRVIIWQHYDYMPLLITVYEPCCAYRVFSLQMYISHVYYMTWVKYI